MIRQVAVLCLALLLLCPVVFSDRESAGGSGTDHDAEVTYRDILPALIGINVGTSSIQKADVVLDGVVDGGYADKSQQITQALLKLYVWTNRDAYEGRCVFSKPALLSQDGETVSVSLADFEGTAQEMRYVVPGSTDSDQLDPITLQFECLRAGASEIQVVLSFECVPDEHESMIQRATVAFGVTKQCDSAAFAGGSFTEGFFVGQTSVASNDVIQNGVTDDAWLYSRGELATVNADTVAKTFFFKSAHPTAIWAPVFISRDESVVTAQASGELSKALSFLSPGRSEQYTLTFDCHKAGHTAVTVAFNVAPLKQGNPVEDIVDEASRHEQVQTSMMRKLEFSFTKMCAAAAETHGTGALGIHIGWEEGHSSVVVNGFTTPLFRSGADEMFTVSPDEHELKFFISSTVVGDPVGLRSPVSAVNPQDDRDKACVQVTLGGTVMGAQELTMATPLQLELGFSCICDGVDEVTVSIPFRPAGSMRFSVLKECHSETFAVTTAPLPGFSVGSKKVLNDYVRDGVPNGGFHPSKPTGELHSFPKHEASMTMYLSMKQEGDHDWLIVHAPSVIVDETVLSPEMTGRGALGGTFDPEGHFLAGVHAHQLQQMFRRQREHKRSGALKLVQLKPGEQGKEGPSAEEEGSAETDDFHAHVHSMLSGHGKSPLLSRVGVTLDFRCIRRGRSRVSVVIPVSKPLFTSEAEAPVDKARGARGIERKFKKGVAGNGQAGGGLNVAGSGGAGGEAALTDSLPPITFSFVKVCGGGDLVGSGGTSVPGLHVGFSPGSSQIVEDGFPTVLYFGQRMRDQEFAAISLVPREEHMSKLYLSYDPPTSATVSVLPAADDDDTNELNDGDDDGFGVGDGDMEEPDATQDTVFVPSIMFAGPVVLSHKAVANPQLNGPAVTGGKLSAGEVMELELVYNCVFDGTASVTVKIPLMPKGVISFTIPKDCRGKVKPVVSAVPVSVGLQPTESDVVFRGQARTAYTMYKPGNEFGHAMVDEYTDTVSFHIRTLSGEEESEAPLIVLATPVVFAHRPVCSPTMTHTLGHSERAFSQAWRDALAESSNAHLSELAGMLEAPLIDVTQSSAIAELEDATSVAQPEAGEDHQQTLLRHAATVLEGKTALVVTGQAQTVDITFNCLWPGDTAVTVVLPLVREFDAVMARSLLRATDPGMQVDDDAGAADAGEVHAQSRDLSHAQITWTFQKRCPSNDQDDFSEFGDGSSAGGGWLGWGWDSEGKDDEYNWEDEGGVDDGDTGNSGWWSSLVSSLWSGTSDSGVGDTGDAVNPPPQTDWSMDRQQLHDDDNEVGPGDSNDLFAAWGDDSSSGGGDAERVGQWGGWDESRWGMDAAVVSGTHAQMPDSKADHAPHDDSSELHHLTGLAGFAASDGTLHGGQVSALRIGSGTAGPLVDDVWRDGAPLPQYLSPKRRLGGGEDFTADVPRKLVMSAQKSFTVFLSVPEGHSQLVDVPEVRVDTTPHAGGGPRARKPVATVELSGSAYYANEVVSGQPRSLTATFHCQRKGVAPTLITVGLRPSGFASFRVVKLCGVYKKDSGSWWRAAFMPTVSILLFACLLWYVVMKHVRKIRDDEGQGAYEPIISRREEAEQALQSLRAATVV